jgi:integrase
VEWSPERGRAQPVKQRLQVDESVACSKVQRCERADHLQSMMEIAEGEERLILRTFLGTGMRKDEVQHLEIEDIDTIRKCIHVHDKPHLGWGTKTAASIREIPLGDSLIW